MRKGDSILVGDCEAFGVRFTNSSSTSSFSPCFSPPCLVVSNCEESNTIQVLSIRVKTASKLSLVDHLTPILSPRIFFTQFLLLVFLLVWSSA